MANIKLILDKRREKVDSTYPLILRLIHNRKSRSIKLGISLADNDWDDKSKQVRKSHPNCKALNRLIKTKYIEAEKMILKLDEDQKTHSLREYKVSIKKEKRYVSFLEYGQTLVEQLKVSNKFGNARVYENTINRLKTIGYKSLDFSDVNYEFLKELEAKFFKGGAKLNTIYFYLKTIRAIYNQAIKAGYTDRNSYPFYNYSIKREPTEIRAISKEKIKLIEDHFLDEGSVQWHNRNYFLLSFYLIGISFIDLATLTVKSIHNGRIIYKRRKTGKLYNIGIVPKAQNIINAYSSVTKNNSVYLLPIIPSKYYGNVEQELNYTRNGYNSCNRSLKLIALECHIEDHITTYTARYSWANIARRLGYSKDLIAEALGHEFGNSTTSIYLDKLDLSLIDEANVKVTA